MRRRRLLLTHLLPLLLALTARPATPADPPSAAEIRAALRDGRTGKAARMAERALAEAPPSTAELRYLLFKAHVVDLGPDGKGEIYRRLAGGERDGMERYEAHLDELEAAVREEGVAGLPVLVELLQGGDRLDRLLVLGLLEGMSRGGEVPDWSAPAGPGLDSPIEAARRATRRAADDCAAREQALGITAGAASIEDQLEREAYVQEVFAAETGLEFLARTDPAAWGAAAARLLACRGAAGAVLEDRARLERNAAHLRGPLWEMLEAGASREAQLRVLDLLGRYGGCGDLPALEALEEAGLQAAASAAAERIRRRGGCP